jgi:GGDEF domain-containing protein
MLADLRKPLDLNGTNYLITASIGIGLYPWDAETAEELVHCTASAMYAAKEQGKDRCSFYNTQSENTCFMQALG